MSKRKLEAFQRAEDNSNELAEPLRLQRQLPISTLDQYEKTLFRALRLARGFERQKLGRRQKVAHQTNDDAETARLNAEVVALKALELSKVARLHLYKSMLKSKPITNAPSFPSYITTKFEATPLPQDTASRNVQARLFNNNAVKTQLTDIMNGIGSLLGVSDGASIRKKGRLRASTIASGGDLTQDVSKNERGKVKDFTSKDQNIQISTLSSPQTAHQAKNTNFSDEGSDDYDAFASRLGNSSDSESGNENKMQRPKQELALEYKRSRTPSFTSSWSPAPSSPKPKRRNLIAAPKSTTFLPSLALGGYISGSDSDHFSVSHLDFGTAEPRKNRRGQQARRQIWEKKFGRNAKHLKGQAQTQDRDQGWDPRAGARSTEGRGKDERRRGRAPVQKGRSGPLSSGANADPIKARATKGENKEKQTEGPLHPSWEAAKRAKEAKKNVAFQGKKLVFD